MLLSAEEMVLDTAIDMNDPCWDLLPDTAAADCCADTTEEASSTDGGWGLEPLCLDSEAAAPIVPTAMMISPVFSFDSPEPLSHSRKRPRPQDDEEEEGLRARPRVVSFGPSNRVRLIADSSSSSSSSSAPLAAKSCAPADDDGSEPIKQNDGPSHVSLLLSVLIYAYFGSSVTTIEQLLAALGPARALEVCESGADVSALCNALADKLEKAAAAGATVGVLPSNVRLGAAHQPGVKQLAEWLQPQPVVVAAAAAPVSTSQ